jgi:hypothetical protein
MDAYTISREQSQSALFDFSDTSTGAVELFPAVWSAAEGLSSPELNVRHTSLDTLVNLGAPRLSPLVAYLLATRLFDPDLGLRSRIVVILGELLARDREGHKTPELVRSYLIAYLSQMRTRLVYGLMQVAVHDSNTKQYIARLLNACPYAGEHLADILSDRKVPLTIRLQAAYFIGQVGYLDVIQDLERLASRLESRLMGQQAMPFAPHSEPDETVLLPAIHNTLTILRSP